MFYKALNNFTSGRVFVAIICLLHVCSFFFFFFSSLICLFSGICADIALSKHEYWSSLAPLPFEVVTSAGQKAKEEPEGWFNSGIQLFNIMHLFLSTSLYLMNKNNVKHQSFRSK